MKRLLLVVVATLATVLVVASAASAASIFGTDDGARSDYTPTETCMYCHGPDVVIGNAPPVVADWMATAHAQVGDAAAHEVNAYPISRGPSCAGCHAGNYDPTKATPTTEGGSTYPTDGSDHAFTEGFVGCSTCHYDYATAHTDGVAQLADPDVCGQCHARYSRSVDTFETAGGTITTQYPVGYNPFTTPLSEVLDIAADLTWWESGQAAHTHGENAVQYDEMAQGWTAWDGTAEQEIPMVHFNSLEILKQAAAAEGLPDSVAVQNCSHCMSADARIIADQNGGSMPADMKLADLKYGDTCSACHTPHKGGTPATWNEERDAQLVMPQEKLCGSCHNAHLAKNASFSMTGEVHHPQDEMMKGYGAIDVAETPALHKGDCVECHMAPTGYEHDGAPATGGNHVFKPIMPEYAATHTTDVGGEQKPMPYSSCSTCHGISRDPLATRLQSVIDDRQAWVEDMWGRIDAALDTAAQAWGFTGETPADRIAAARAGFSALDHRIADQANFLKAVVNKEFTEIDGSRGIHNWQYARRILNAALSQARSVRAPVDGVTITTPAEGTMLKVRWGNSATIEGTVQVDDPLDLIGSQARLWAKRADRDHFSVVASAFVVDGGFSFPITPSRTSTYRVQFMGSDGYAPATSGDAQVGVRFKVTLKPSSTSVRRYAHIRLSGKVYPATLEAGTKVTIKRYVRNHWRTFTTARVRSDGTYSVRVRLTARTLYRLRAYAPASEYNLAWHSGTVKVRVR